MVACTGFIILGMLSIPVEHAAVVNEETTTHVPLYLPHIEGPISDDYHWWAWPNHNESEKMQLAFCETHGFHPPFAEGQTLKWMRYKKWPTCIELEGADCFRHWVKGQDGKPSYDCIKQEDN